MASTDIDPNLPAPYIHPTEIYGGTNFNFNINDNLGPDSPWPFPPINLRIATGGAGQSGLLRKLANAFIEYEMRKTYCPRFSIAWLPIIRYFGEFQPPRK